MILKIKYKTLGNHVHALHYIGPNEDHLAFSGELIFNQEEWREYEYWMKVINRDEVCYGDIIIVKDES